MSLRTDMLDGEAERLRSDRVAFVTATVVRADRPTSAKPGDRALVLADGTMVGFVGGECAKSSVQIQALAALETGEAVLLRIDPEVPPSGPTPRAVQSGSVTVHNPCLSGGALEIFLEPTVPPPLVVIHGDAPIAQALHELGSWLGLDTSKGGGELPPGTAAVLVASHGDGEHQAITDALDAGVGYVGLIASLRRGEAVLGAIDLSPAKRTRVHTPAGLDIGARSPKEVAVSVLAELISLRPRATIRQPNDSEPQLPGAPAATDPVCAMSVAAIESSRHIDHEGVRYFFCGSGCEDAFRADPHSFVRQ